MAQADGDDRCADGAVAKGVAADLFGLSPALLARSVFPGTEALRPVGGLVV